MTFRKETDDVDQHHHHHHASSSSGGGMIGMGMNSNGELELHGYEVAALMNLVATDTLVEEAVSLIPSLSRFPEASIEEILDLVRSTMIRIVS
jgi:hypothetical protein